MLIGSKLSSHCSREDHSDSIDLDKLLVTAGSLHSLVIGTAHIEIDIIKFYTVKRWWNESLSLIASVYIHVMYVSKCCKGDRQ